MIKNIIFDFGNVLVNYDFDILFRNIYPDEDKRKAFADFINDPGRVQVLDRGMKPFHGIIEDFISERPDLEEEFIVFEKRKPEVVLGEVPGMRDMLEKLKSGGFGLYGLTNWDTQVHITIAQYGIFRLLDGRVISSEEHLVKPEREIYLRLLDRFGLAADECVFVDDKPENIEGAEKVGIKGIVFKDAAQFEKELDMICKSTKA